MLVLASNSPRRRQILALAGWEFTILPANVDESELPGEDAEAYGLRLAGQKAYATAEKSPPGSTIIAADTIVVDGTEILGKPATGEEARQVLTRLRGRTHQVFTALAVLHRPTGALLTDWVCTQVRMRAYKDEEIAAYIQSGDPFDKAGSYAIQHPGFAPVESLSGCYGNVVGLPLCHLTRLLNRLGIQPSANAAVCYTVPFTYQCQVRDEIVREGS